MNVPEIRTELSAHNSHRLGDIRGTGHLWSWTPLELMEPTLRKSFSRNEVSRCIHIGLLCVQEDPADRPMMVATVLMFNSFSVMLPLRKRPAFFDRSTTRSNTPSMNLE
ncbi:hypothetical protein Ddye_003931 [Dipteronia dyeriana]|uniref:S-locus receptor kinase C-terminal domain-containing protein n=1 Tax=Dipteronia dyeriana TaxID=168575 RepID=A0AAD9XUD4_9ROSI|nr:hypothetical protein Ddye_003931 [Dipteronia dyeriana]